jgi:hypothetical protein
VLRVSKDPQALDPVNLCDPETSPAGMNRDPHVSRSVLSRVIATTSVVANNLAQLAHHQATCRSPADTAAYSAVACPLASTSGDGPALRDPPPRLGQRRVDDAAEPRRRASTAGDAFWARPPRPRRPAAVIEREMVMARDVQAARCRAA